MWERTFSCFVSSSVRPAVRHAVRYIVRDAARHAVKRAVRYIVRHTVRHAVRHAVNQFLTAGDLENTGREAGCQNSRLSSGQAGLWVLGSS